MKMESENGIGTVNVVRHIILKNFWEVYVTDYDHNDPDLAEAVVYGYETELGDVRLSEYKKITISDTTELDGLAPAPGWKWVN